MFLQSVEASNWLPGPKLFPPGCLQYRDLALRLAGLRPLVDRRQAHPGHQPAPADYRLKRGPDGIAHQYAPYEVAWDVRIE